MTVMQGVRVTVAAVGRGYPKTAVTTVTAVTPKDGHPPKERRNPPMPYAILRFQKRKAGGVAACERHNERKKEAYKSNPDIDMERSKNNYHLIAPPKYTYKKEINRMVAEAGCRTRKDSVMMVETLITASPEFMNQLPPEEQKAYFQTALDFISERVGKQNILSAVVHMDERTPHMHLCFVPITPDNELSAKAILGNQKSLSEWQTAYHERMSSRWNQLERGQSSMETKRKHVPTWLYKLGGRLDKQYEEIVSALSDINAFNAGKKRDKALDLLSAWLPDVEKFSKEIGKQQAYIDSLKERIGQESDYAGRMRDEKYEQELKVQKANQKIFELQRTNEQMAACEWWMDIFGIADLKDRNFLQLSSGEQRLVLLARAFVKDPELLILDEPLHGLDLYNRRLVKDVIETFCRRKDKTMIMVTHYQEELPACITNFLFLKRN